MIELTDNNITAKYWGHYRIKITDKDIEDLKEGKQLYAPVAEEYTVSLVYEREN